MARLGLPRAILTFATVAVLLAGCATPEAPGATSNDSPDGAVPTSAADTVGGGTTQTGNAGSGSAADAADGSGSSGASATASGASTGADIPSGGAPAGSGGTDNGGTPSTGGATGGSTPSAPTSSGSTTTPQPQGAAFDGNGFVIAASLNGALSSMVGADGGDVAQKLASKFPPSAGYAIGLFLDDAALEHLGTPATLLQDDASILIMKGFNGDVNKLHYLHVVGKSHDLLSYVGVTGSSQVRLIIADSQTEQAPATMSVKEITAWSSTSPAFASTQGYAFGTTMKTVTRAAEAAGLVTGGTATAVIRTINSLPFDVGVYDTAQFEGTSASDTRSYHVTMVRFFGGENRELPELVQPPYTLAARDVQIKGFLVPLQGSSLKLDSLADQWTSQSNVLDQISNKPSSALAGFAGKDVLGSFGEGTQNFQQAKAVFLVVEVELAEPVGNHRLKDVTASTFATPVTHTKIQGYAAPTVLMDFTFVSGQPKLHQLALTSPAAGAVTIDGIYIRTNAQDSALAATATSALTQNDWAKAVADAGSTWSNVIVTNNGILFPYSVTPTGIGAPLTMLLKNAGGQLSWTPTIANSFAKYEVRQSTLSQTSATDGTLLTTITNAQTTTYSLPASTTGYVTVWAFNDIGNTPSTPIYIEAAPTVGLTSVTYCSSNIRTCLHATWSQYSGSGFEKYELQRKTGSGSWAAAHTITSVSTTSISDNGLTCGTTYEYKVVIYASGKTGESNVLSGNPNNGFGFCDQPTTTLNYVVYCSTNQKTCLKSGWSVYSGQGFEKYELQRRVGTSGAWSVAATITDIASTDYSDNGLTCGTTYNYRVVLYVAGGSSESNVVAGNPNNGFGGCY